jgi:hypothetical protein
LILCAVTLLAIILKQRSMKEEFDTGFAQIRREISTSKEEFDAGLAQIRREISINKEMTERITRLEKAAVPAPNIITVPVPTAAAADETEDKVTFVQLPPAAPAPAGITREEMLAALAAMRQPAPPPIYVPVPAPPPRRRNHTIIVLQPAGSPPPKVVSGETPPAVATPGPASR